MIKKRTRPAALLAFIVAMLLPGFTAHSLGKTDGILREYVKDATLTQEQEKIVIELAKKRGVNKIAKIKTYYIRPSSDREISVYGVELVKGREATQSIIRMKHKGWTHHSIAPKKDDMQIGDFWAGRAGMLKTAIMMVGEKEYRIGIPHGMSIEQSESILKQLQTGKYTLGANIKKEHLKGIDWNSPKSFSKFGEIINVSFNERDQGDGFYSLRLTLTKNKLQINEIMLAMP